MKKIIILAIIAIFIGIYWRGTKAILAKAGMDCDWHVFYAFCKSPTKNPPMPNFMEIFKQGTKF
ncbi:MAG: hypothetical protein KW788_00700 [Candidatus Doudnabacteria bacterium]|nr:hypothetical protein [Candidatus Doudnabacteria bacterium]